MTTIARRFDDEAAVLRGLVELRRNGVPLFRLEAELTKMGPVDLDMLHRVMDRVFDRLEAESAPRRYAPVTYPTGVFSAAG